MTRILALLILFCGLNSEINFIINPNHERYKEMLIHSDFNIVMFLDSVFLKNYQNIKDYVQNLVK